MPLILHGPGPRLTLTLSLIHISAPTRSYAIADSGCWVEKNNWITFLSENKSKEYLSNTGITFKICEEWYLSKNEDEQRSIVKQICKILSEEDVAHDINGYAKAPPSFRVWAGGTVESLNIELLLPWLDWAYSEVRKTYA